MFTEVQIENYKSIQSLKINLGRVNVFIGENGCGKSNILEAIALAAAAAADKLDNEFLVPRGIRVTEPEFMRSAFDKENVTKVIKITLQESNKTSLNFAIQHNNQTYSKWNNVIEVDPISRSLINVLDKNTHDQILDILKDVVNESVQKVLDKRKISNLIEVSEWINEYKEKMPYEYIEKSVGLKSLTSYIVYLLDYSSLRTFEEEGQIQPLGSKGQGLLKLLRVLNSTTEKINEIKYRLELIDWFDDFKIHQDSDIERTIQIKDRYLDKDLSYFNQRSSNEGFLFLMFYFALFISDDTPKFFAIDNIENALNPKLCTRLIQELVELAKKYDKQVIFTTHNPAVLDGLDLNDDEQRLFVIYRNMDGHTKARRISAPEPLEDDEPVRLSEAFINGYLGGLPKNF